MHGHFLQPFRCDDGDDDDDDDGNDEASGEMECKTKIKSKHTIKHCLAAIPSKKEELKNKYTFLIPFSCFFFWPFSIHFPLLSRLVVKRPAGGNF